MVSSRYYLVETEDQTRADKHNKKIKGSVKEEDYQRWGSGWGKKG